MQESTASKHASTAHNQPKNQAHPIINNLIKLIQYPIKHPVHALIYLTLVNNILKVMADWRQNNR